ncbi:MAG: hypothetical protein GYA14_11255 [Ignavibacteria bacterium]|nr:hypothetical protein [Ignavibacteria bacterium]
MKRILSLALVLTLFAAYSSLLAQTQDPPKPKEHGKKFVDNNGDGYNDNAPDHDGDGIPNGLDPDWLALKNKNAKGKFVDLNGDGIKDNPGKGKGKMGKGGYGPADGTGNKGVGPKDGTGNSHGEPSTTQTQTRGGKKWGKK